MATIDTKEESRIYEIRKFLGLHESADGDTQLELGEGSELENWQVTPQHHLRVRPGYRSLHTFHGPIRGLWAGFAAGERKLLCVADGAVWELNREPVRRIGDIQDAPTTIFGFGGKVYFLNGHEYLTWDGEGFVDTVEGYVPLVSTAVAPAGGGTAVENVNRLTGRRRCRFSADGTSTEFHLPEENLLAVEKVVLDTRELHDWTADLESGVVTFETAPPAGDSNVEIWYAAANSLRPQVEAMGFAEQFNGAADTRVFLYGDGSAKAIYCGVTESGVASAEYFPDLYEVFLGGDQAPITGMIKYSDRLLSFKADGGAFSTRYETTTLADGSSVPGFMTVCVNREIGNGPMGQVRLVQNVPRTVWGSQIYDWVMASYYTRDERNAKCVSSRIQVTMEQADPEKVFCFDDDTKQEYYIFLNDDAGTVLVHHYGIDVWYRYTGLPVKTAVRFGEKLLFGLADGRVVHFSEQWPNDDGEIIHAVFASGHMSFDRQHKRKHSSTLWVSVKPTANARMQVSVRSDRRGDYPEKAVIQSLSSFRQLDFSRMSFLTNRSPQVQRLKLKVKKFVYYQMLLESHDRASDATVLGADIQVRYTGPTK